MAVDASTYPEHVGHGAMPKLNIDLRFAIIALEPFAARRHVEVALKRIQRLEEDIRGLVLEELRANGYEDDDVERSIAYQEIYHLEEELPRLEAYAAIFVLFASFESVVKRLPHYVGPWNPADVTKGKGDGFIGKAARFYRETVGVPLFSDQPQEQFIRNIAALRHAIAHATGQFSMLNSAASTRISRIVATDDRVRLDGDRIQIDSSFILEAAEAMNNASRELIERLKKAYPRGTYTPQP